MPMHDALQSEALPNREALDRDRIPNGERRHRVAMVRP
jgi:hypothetical protein